VILPGAASSEKNGSFTNMEGRIQSFEPAIPLPGEAKPDWEILDLLGKKLGPLEPYRSVEQIRHEIARLVPGYTDLGGGRTAWVKENSRSGLFRSEGEGDSASFSRYSSLPAEKPDREFPYKAIMGSPRFHLGSGTRTSHSSRIMDYAYEGEVEISPEDARSLGLRSGEIVIVSSAYGAIRRKIMLTDGVRPGLIYVPGAVHGHDAASLFPLDRSEGAEAQGMNVVSVKVKRGGGPIHDI
jgi:formate dehydrogenase alpha subunit